MLSKDALMTNVPIPEDSILAAIGGLILGAFAWLLKLERRPPGLTAKEHERICTIRQAEVTDKLRELKRMLENQDTKSEERSREINAIKVTVAVLESQGARAASKVP